MSGKTGKTVSLDDFLTSAEIERCFVLWLELRGTGRFASTVAEEIIAPNLARINTKLGQENDARFLSYAVEYVLVQSAGRPRI